MVLNILRYVANAQIQPCGHLWRWCRGKWDGRRKLVQLKMSLGNSDRDLASVTTTRESFDEQPVGSTDDSTEIVVDSPRSRHHKVHCSADSMVEASVDLMVLRLYKVNCRSENAAGRWIAKCFDSHLDKVG